MTSIFQKRESSDFGSAITKYNAGEWDLETKTLYLMGRKPLKFFEKFKETPEWNNFLKSKGASNDQPIMELAALASEELVYRIVDKEMIDKIAADIINKIESNPERKFTSVRIASPFPLDPDATTNTFAPALAAAVTAGLEAMLPNILQERGIANLEVIADLDKEKSSKDDSILNIVNNQRGNTSNPEKGEEVATYMQRLSRQAVYSGKVDKNAIYVPVDDFLVSQSTMVGLMSYINDGGALTTSAVAGIKLFNGTEVLQPKQETLDLLNLAIKDKIYEVKAVGGENQFKASINKILNKAGLNIDFEDISKTTLSNIELLFVAGYFSDGENQKHQQGFANAMKAIGGSVDEAKGNSSHDVFNSPSGTLVGLEGIFEKVLNDRDLLADTNSKRYTELVNQNRILDFKGAQNAI